MTNDPGKLLRNSPNMNMLWGGLVVEELVRNGVDLFVVSPGSRSTPVTWAVAANPRARSVVHFDERGAAYCALGAAKASGRPVALVCTSGTAVANFFPAVVEAAASCIPLILLTADRPPELSDAGANQTIDQTNIYGKYPRWFINLPCPSHEIPGHAVLTAIDQAVYRARRAPAGPVHVNLMFREPLAPIETGENLVEMTAPLGQWESSRAPYTVYDQADHVANPEALRRLAGQMRGAKCGILIAGQVQSRPEADSILELARFLDWPVFPDVASGLRFGPAGPPFIHYYDQMLLSESFREFCQPDMVVQVGSPCVSKRLHEHLQECKPDRYVLVANHPRRHDPAHMLTARIESALPPFCRGLIATLEEAGNSEAPPGWRKEMLRWNNECHKAIGGFLADCGAGVSPAHLTEPAIAHMLPTLVPSGATLLLSSSMPIRDVDMYGAPADTPVFATANRGASGIDGVLATAAGYAHNSSRPVIAYLGDLALLHDLNSLALLSKVDAPVIVVVANNAGGGIFSFLPIAGFPEHFEEFWGAPHPYTFKAAAEMFGVPYTNPATVAEFAAAVKAAMNSGTSALIEASTSRDENLKLHQALQERIRTALDG